jgi:hypothetical protein
MPVHPIQVLARAYGLDAGPAGHDKKQEEQE